MTAPFPSGAEDSAMAGFNFDEQMIADALEANGWVNVWDIYWMNRDDPGWGALTMEDAFRTLLDSKKLLPRRDPGQSSHERPQ
jgi:hypothetical protein